MAKIMLVEDDNNLREIYEARLLAEGYEIISAHDGEEALAVAVKEKPDLIISDVMMPKISGFDMLDILRTTPETKNTKVVMMTALSQAEDRERANKLGADRYLVKSQVTLEDVAKVAREMLDGGVTTETPAVPPTPESSVTNDNTADAKPAVDQEPVVAEPNAPAIQPVVVKPVEPNTDSSSTNNDSPANDTPSTLNSSNDKPNEPPTSPTEPPKEDKDDNVNTPPDNPNESPPADSTDSSQPGASDTTADAPKNDNAAITAAISSPVIDPSLSQTIASEEADIEKQIDEFVQSTYGESEDSTQAQEAPVNDSQSQVNVPISDASELDGDDTNNSHSNPIASSSANIKQIKVAEAPADSDPETPKSAPISPEPTVTEPSQPPASEDNEPTVQAAEPRAPITKEPADGNISGKKVIMPLNDISKPVDMNKLLQAEHDKESVQEAFKAAEAPQPGPVFASVDEYEEEPNATAPPGTTIGPDPNSIAL